MIRAVALVLALVAALWAAPAGAQVHQASLSSEVVGGMAAVPSRAFPKSILVPDSITLAQRFLLLGVGGGGSGPVYTPVLTATTSQAFQITSGSGTTTCVYVGVDIGNPTYIATRLVIVVMNSHGLSSIGLPITATVGVASATIDSDIIETGANAGAHLFQAAVASGTTATVTVVWSTTWTCGAGISVYITDASQLISTSPTVATFSDSTGTATSKAMSVAGTSPGFVIGIVGFGTGSGNLVTSSGYTLDYNNQFGPGIGNFHLIPISTGTQSVTPTWATGSFMSGILASWH